jgi:hypothetical protein
LYSFSVDVFDNGFYFFLCFTISYAVGSRIGERLGTFYSGNYVPLARISYVVPAACLLVLTAFLLWFRSFDVLVSDRGGTSEAVAAISDSFAMIHTALNGLVRAPTLAAFILLTCLYLDARHRNDYRAAKIVGSLTIVGCTTLLANFPTAIPRFWLGAALLSFITAFISINRKNANISLALLMPGALLVLFPLANVLRFYFSAEERTTDLGYFIAQSYLHGQFDAFQMGLIVVDYANAFGLQWGRQMLGATFFWIPRSLWPDKPISSGTMVASSLGFDFTNLSSPFAAEAYLDFGLPGMLISGAVYGAISRRIEKSLAMGWRGPQFVVFVFLVGWQVILLRGSMITAASSLVPFIVAVIVFRVLTFRLSAARSSHPAGAP